MTSIPATPDLEAMRRKHRMARTWDSGNPEAVDGWVTWCKGCHQRPWPCDFTVRDSVGDDRIAELQNAIRSLSIEWNEQAALDYEHNGKSHDWCNALRECSHLMVGRLLTDVAALNRRQDDPLKETTE